MTNGAVESMSAVLAGGDPSHPALIVADTGQVLTYAQTAARVETLAQGLAGLGVRRGDRVALSLPNGPDFVLLLLAITALGAAAAPLNPAYTETEFGFYLTDIAPALLLIPASGAAAATAAAAGTGTTLIAVEAADDGPPQLLGAGGPAPLQRSFEPGGPDDVALVLHTSGTTSRPKQVPLRQRNLMASARTIAAHYQLGADDVSFCVMPLFHVHGLVASTFAALGGRRRGRCPPPVHPAPVLAAGPRARRHLAVGRADAAPDDPRPRRRRRPAGDAAVRPLVQLGAVARAAGARGERVRRADARGLRHDRGEPPDDLQPAAARRPDAGLGRRADRHRDRRRRRRRHASCPREPPARSSSAARA